MFSTAHSVSLNDSPSGVELLVDGNKVAMVSNAGTLVLFAQAGGPPSPFHGLALDGTFRVQTTQG